VREYPVKVGWNTVPRRDAENKNARRREPDGHWSDRVNTTLAGRAD
jgi:hypothetical protein